MARYIDADALLSRLPDDLPYKASVKRVLMQAHSADVAPKSEVAREIFAEIKKAIKEEVLDYCNCFEKAELHESREYYKTKQDTAIFLYMKIDHLEKKEEKE